MCGASEETTLIILFQKSVLQYRKQANYVSLPSLQGPCSREESISGIHGVPKSKKIVWKNLFAHCHKKANPAQNGSHRIYVRENNVREMNVREMNVRENYLEKVTLIKCREKRPIACNDESIYTWN
ncbi:hypothetical protein AYI69_g11263 [Smittium culicis]|uniref:Uncharacterized protein n=1 Tax=Smittium culicis TaxID=133412 RepID=A0A1R1WZW2_9FUNG|nr:hypothetical protein AYI69_g11263 [Smittium culicis]